MTRFRPARPARRAWNVTKTVIFLLVFWVVGLFLLPIGISIIEVELGIQRFPPLPVAAASMLLGFTALGVWAAITMAIVGRGTPASFDTARELVVTGPYAFLRHPLAAATAGQGVGLGVALGSVPVLVYVTGAVAIWYFLVRGGEERDLEARFGKRWTHYARAVRGFRPRLTPYRPLEDDK